MQLKSIATFLERETFRKGWAEATNFRSLVTNNGFAKRHEKCFCFELALVRLEKVGRQKAENWPGSKIQNMPFVLFGCQHEIWNGEKCASFETYGSYLGWRLESLREMHLFRAKSHGEFNWGQRQEGKKSSGGRNSSWILIRKSVGSERKELDLCLMN